MTYTREQLEAVMEKHYPRIEPAVQRSPNMYGDDRAVDDRDDERAAIDGFIDALLELEPELDPNPWCYVEPNWKHNVNKIISRSYFWSEDHELFNPRSQYSQRYEDYPE